MSKRIPKKLRLAVAKRANFKCEYCGVHEGNSFFSFEIDHIISIKHGGSTLLDNLANSCFPCNNRKGSDVGGVILPDKTFVRLFDPRVDNWEDHFYLEHGVIHSKTNIGAVTVKLLQMNDVERIIERRLIMD